VQELDVIQVVASWRVKKTQFRAEAVYRFPRNDEERESMARHLYNRFQQEIVPGFSEDILADLVLVTSKHTVRGMAAARMETIFSKQSSGELPMWLLPPDAEARYATRKEV